MATSTVSYLWRDQKAHEGFRTGVSLHSHTNQSRETLDFLANLGGKYAVIRRLLAQLERRSEKAVQMLGSGPVSGGLRMAWNAASQLRLALGQRESYSDSGDRDEGRRAGKHRAGRRNGAGRGGRWICGGDF